MSFTHKPNYKALQGLFRTLFSRLYFSYDFVFDWNMLKFGKLCLSDLGYVSKDK